MPATDELLPDTLHLALDAALKAGDFDSATRLSSALGAAVAVEISASPSPNRAAILKRRLSLLEEHLSLARVLRAHVASRLEANHAASRYQDDGVSSSCWRFDV